VAISDWATVELCQDRDLAEQEERAVDWCKPRGDARRWRDLAKKRIGEKLRRGLHQEQKTVSESEVLNLIENPEALNTVAVYYTLYLIANDRMTHPNDYYAGKAAHYLQLFKDEWPQAKSDLHFDLDEDGSIDDAEKFNVRTGVRIQRGA
jgi:hypothetical protein